MSKSHNLRITISTLCVTFIWIGQRRQQKINRSLQINEETRGTNKRWIIALFSLYFQFSLMIQFQIVFLLVKLLFTYSLAVIVYFLLLNVQISRTYNAIRYFCVFFARLRRRLGVCTLYDSTCCSQALARTYDICVLCSVDVYAVWQTILVSLMRKRQHSTSNEMTFRCTVQKHNKAQHIGRRLMNSF